MGCRRAVELVIRTVVIAAAAVAGACSSGAPASSETGNGKPATVQVATGDGQSGNPGSTLAAPISVVVKDASGAPVAGVHVTFSVDSGGGSLTTLVVTTGADGTASAGSWTLGTTAGTNVVTAHVGSLVPLSFHAQALGNMARPLVTNATVTPSGGAVEYQKPGDPLNGLMVTVPAAAYTTPTQWSIVADSSVRPPLPADFSQVGPALVISNGQGYADSVMTLTMPLHVDTSMAVAPFYFDPSTGTMEGIPVVARTDSSITLAARHFSGDLMAIPGRAAGAGVRAALHAAFGSVRIVWVQLPTIKLLGSYTTGFLSGQDNWEFPNYGDYMSPDGDCEGMSVTAMYYYYFVKATGRPSLYHHFDVSLENPWDNVQGIRFVGAVQHDYDLHFHAGADQVATLTAEGKVNGVDPGVLTAQWITMTIKLTQQPVLMALYGPNVGHAVVATAVGTQGTVTTVVFSDPNYPTQSREMTFRAGVLDPIPLQANANSASVMFNQAYAVGVTADIPLTTIDADWSDFLAKQAASQYEPSYQLEAYDSAGSAWTPVTDTFRTAVSPVKLRARCELCDIFAPGVNPPDLQAVTVFDDSGVVRLDDNKVPASFPVNAGTNDYVTVFYALSPFGSTTPPQWGYVDSHVLTVVYNAFTLLPSKINDKVDSTYTFTASSGGVATSHSTFVWQFGDGTDSAVVVGDSTVTHRFPAPGTYAPSVTMYDDSGNVVARASSQVKVAVTVIRAIWQFSSASSSNDLSVTLDSSDDKAAQRTVDDVMSAIAGTPGSTLIFVADSADCRAVVAERFTGAVSLALVPGVPKYALGGSCKSNPQVYLGSISVGTIGDGSLLGSVGEGAFQSIAWSGIPSAATSIDAAMGGGQLAGTVYFTVDYLEGAAEYTLSFTANQLFPAPGAGLRAAVRRR